MSTAPKPHKSGDDGRGASHAPRGSEQGREPTNAQPEGVVRIANRLAAGGEPAHVSIQVDGGDRPYTVRTSDLENIGVQLRGKTRFSFFNTILPVIITLLTVVGTTLVGQLFQYVSWRNSTALQTVTLQAQRAVSTYQKASLAISKRYYATVLFLAATTDLANRKTDVESKLYKLSTELDQKRFNEYYTQVEAWNDDYDQTLTAINYDLDGPVLRKHERVSAADFENGDKKMNCNGMLLTELNTLHLNYNSLTVQFSALNYCFIQSHNAFSEAADKAIIDKVYSIGSDVKKRASDLNENVRSMSNEFRCFAQHRIGFLEQRKQTAIFRLPTALHDWFVPEPDLLPGQLKQSLEGCSPADELKILKP
jgi:hypothetical protein